jgi:hypothetical protein
MTRAGSIFDEPTEAMISLCDRSGVMCVPWAEAGFTCYAVDLQHPVRKARVQLFEGGGKIIYQYGDARYWTPQERIRAVFFACFPTCTDMAGSGAQDYSGKRGTPRKGIPQLCDGLMLFNSCYHAAAWSGAPFLVENPSGVIPTHFRKADYTFHPWHYGDDYQKMTCLWTGNGFVMPEKECITKGENVTQKIWEMSPGKDRADKRAETPAGFARAVYEANRAGSNRFKTIK